jgi:hypothetical protein
MKSFEFGRWRRRLSLAGGRKMSRDLTIVLTPEAASAIERIGKITGDRKVIEVLSDALRTYEWVLKEQASHKKVVALNETGLANEEEELAPFIVDEAAARSYFSGA